MPYSSNLLDDIAEQTLRLIPIATHLDIGAGAGKYGRMSMRLHPDARRTAVEVWPPYVERFGLQRLYHEVRVIEASDLLREPDAAWDVVTLGDVLEHLPKSAGVDLLEFLIYRSRAIWVQAPLHYLQDTIDGNPREAHQSIWTARDLEAYEGRITQRGDMLGAWLWGWRAEYADWYGWAHGLQDAAMPSIDAARALAVRAERDLRIFVETGIWHGGTTRWAADHFERVFACDLDGQWVSHAMNRLRQRQNLQVEQADSRPFLLNLLTNLREPALIYLDAHCIAGDPADCPLIGELNAVRVSKQPHVVVIDDARLIVGRDPAYLAWPTLDQVRAALPGWTIAHEGRALWCFPEAA